MQFSTATLCRRFLHVLKEEYDYNGALNLFLNKKERTCTLLGLSYHVSYF